MIGSDRSQSCAPRRATHRIGSMAEPTPEDSNDDARHEELETARRAIAGDRAAQEAVYHQHGPYLFSLASRILGSREAARDVFQDSFVRAIEKMHTVRDPAALRAWLAQVVVNRCRSTLKREGFRRRLGLSSLFSEKEYVPPENFVLNGRLAWTDVTRLLARLPTDTRVMWWLQRVERHTVVEVAELTGSTVDKVKKRLVAADRALTRYREEGGFRD